MIIKAIKRIAVLGAGTMGHGIAQLFASHGKQVTLYDPYPESLERAKEAINRQALQLDADGDDLALSRSAQTGSCLKYTTVLQEAVGDAELIIESIPEQLELKQALYRELYSLILPDAIVASNTSSYSLESLADGQGIADRLLIMHFFNPAHLIPLVELVPPIGGTVGQLEPIQALLRSCAKTPVILSRDIPGFIANRLQAALIREALHLLEQGIASAEDIDLAITDGPGLRWSVSGPLQIVDDGGLDVWSRVLDRLLPELDPTEQSPKLLKELQLAGHLGVKSGQGIYNYTATQRETGVAERQRRFAKVLKAKRYGNE